jgi:hypothetical protein
MKILYPVVLAGLWLASWLPGPAVLAVSVGQVDTFGDGTTRNWVVALLGASSPAPPVAVATGGPAGAGDGYLLLGAVGGNGPGSRLAVINVSQWAGDYLAAGVNAIAMDANNFGSASLSLRLLFADALPGSATNLAFSSAAVELPAGSGWKPLVFPILPGDLVAGTGTAAAALSSAKELRVFHSPTAEFPPPIVVASLGVDNIEAIPEPSAVLLLGLALMRLAPWRRRA